MAETPAKRRKVDGHRQAPNDLSFEDFAPDGDVVFIVKGGTRVRVYSDVMKRASKVFAAMLRPNFKEGRALAEASTTPVEIALPEDEPEHFGWICRALHCQASTKLWKPVTSGLVSVWMLVDKYDMKDSMQLSLGFWIGVEVERKTGDTSHSDFWLLAQMSLGAQDSESFRSATLALILYTKAPFVYMATFSGSSRSLALIPDRLLYKLAATLQMRRDSAMARLVKLLYSDLPEKLHDCNSATALYSRQLKNEFQGLSAPLDFPGSTTSIREVYHLVIPSIIGWASGSPCHCDVQRCPGNFRKLRDKAFNFLRLPTTPTEGLCLDCFNGPKCPLHK